MSVFGAEWCGKYVRRIHIAMLIWRRLPLMPWILCAIGYGVVCVSLCGVYACVKYIRVVGGWFENEIQIERQSDRERERHNLEFYVNVCCCCSLVCKNCLCRTHCVRDVWLNEIESGEGVVIASGWFSGDLHAILSHSEKGVRICCCCCLAGWLAANFVGVCRTVFSHFSGLKMKQNSIRHLWSHLVACSECEPDNEFK